MLSYTAAKAPRLSLKASTKRLNLQSQTSDPSKLGGLKGCLLPQLCIETNINFLYLMRSLLNYIVTVIQDLETKKPTHSTWSTERWHYTLFSGNQTNLESKCLQRWFRSKRLNLRLKNLQTSDLSKLRRSLQPQLVCAKTHINFLYLRSLLNWVLDSEKPIYSTQSTQLHWCSTER